MLNQIAEAGNYSCSEEYLSLLPEDEAEVHKMTMYAFNAQLNQLAKLNLKKSRRAIRIWWEEADENKMKGFYVDLKNKVWQEPNIITKDNYRTSYHLTWPLILLIRVITATKDMLTKAG